MQTTATKMTRQDHTKPSFGRRLVPSTRVRSSEDEKATLNERVSVRMIRRIPYSETLFNPFTPKH